VQPPIVDVIVPGAWSTDGLATTLVSLASQRYPAFRVIAARPPSDPGGSSLSGITAILEARGHPVSHRELPVGATAGRRRQLLFEQTAAPYVLVLDDGVYLEPDLLGRLVAAIRTTRCGVIGSAVVDLRYRNEHRPSEQDIEFWDGPVRPEDVQVGTRAWGRRRVHRGANLEHLRERLPRTRDRLYRIADIRGCVLYDRAILLATGGFAPVADRSQHLPVDLEAAAQLRVLGRAGGAGLFPSGAYRIVAGHPIEPGDGSGAPMMGEGTEPAAPRPAARAPRWIRPGRAWGRALTRGIRRARARRQIRAPGLSPRRMTARQARGSVG
jgi:hypothetical protein